MTGKMEEIRKSMIENRDHIMSVQTKEHAERLSSLWGVPLDQFVWPGKSKYETRPDKILEAHGLGIRDTV